MKLPVVWILRAFAAGIGLAMATPRPASAAFWVVAALTAMLTGGTLAWRGLLPWPRGCAALAAWCALDGAEVGLEQAEVPANHVTRLRDRSA